MSAAEAQPVLLPAEMVSAPSWRRETSRRIKAVARSEALYALFDPWGCGPFDGGCLMFADALQRAFGLGQLSGLMGYHVLYHAPKADWQHAVVQLGADTYADGDGISTARTLRRRWRDKELTHVERIDPMAPRLEWAQRYPEPPYDEGVVQQIVDLLKAALDEA